MLVLGIGGWLHDGAAAILRDGEIIAAIEEEKLTRRPHSNALPEQAVEACLAAAGATREQVGYVAIARPLGNRGDSLFHVRLKSAFPNARLLSCGSRWLWTPVPISVAVSWVLLGRPVAVIGGRHLVRTPATHALSRGSSARGVFPRWR